jgi:glycine dehydrogenase subunit 1
MLEALFEFQTMMCALTATDVSNASHYDGATALAEAAWMAFRRKKGAILYSRYLNPMYQRVLKTYFAGHEEFLSPCLPEGGVLRPAAVESKNPVSAVIVQSPNYLGRLEEIDTLAESAHSRGAILIACVQPVALGIVEAPGNQGADLVVGEGQPLGNPLAFGGPYFGFLSAKKEFTRKLPGRIVGRTLDRDGRPGYVLTLQAREQHIRREKATSNICTNQALCALRAAIHLAYLGPRGFMNLARENLYKSRYFFERLTRLPGIRPVAPGPFFNEFAIRLEDRDAGEVLSFLRKRNILAGVRLEPDYPEIKNGLLVCVTEKRNEDDLLAALEAWKEALAS